jgi:hypothetical protein
MFSEDSCDLVRKINSLVDSLELVDFIVVDFGLEVTETTCVLNKVSVHLRDILVYKGFHVYETLSFVFVPKRMIVCERYHFDATGLVGLDDETPYGSFK